MRHLVIKSKSRHITPPWNTPPLVSEPSKELLGKLTILVPVLRIYRCLRDKFTSFVYT